MPAEWVAFCDDSPFGVILRGGYGALFVALPFFALVAAPVKRQGCVIEEGKDTVNQLFLAGSLFFA